MKLNLLVLLCAVIVLSVSCNQKKKANDNLAPNVHQVTAQEVIQSNNYTYLRVSEDSRETWIAISKREAEVGKTYYYEPNIEMNDFVSKELNRTFKSIFFVEKFSDQPILNVKVEPTNTSKGNQPAIAKQGIKVEPIEGGITIAELYSNKDTYAGKTVKIRGEVVKYNAQIMGKNWVHLQDGTNSNGSFDITVTTNDVTKIGDVVTFEGSVTLKKDFGAGYYYEILVENAKMLPQM